MARKFLGLIAILTGLVIIAAFVWRIFAPDLMRFAFVPSQSFAQYDKPAAPDYTQDAAWQIKPGFADHPALFAPEGYKPAPKAAAALFYVTPTAWLSKTGWNAPLNDAQSEPTLAGYAKTQASLFNGVAQIWAPRYRQATFGAFLQPGTDADQAMDLAYGDVLKAFDRFLAQQPADVPLILAGHSQGSRHVLHLLRDRKDVLANRIAAVYTPGWPVTAEDLVQIGLPVCSSPEQAGCLLTWQTYAADAEFADAQSLFAATKDLAGQPVGNRKLICTNPLSGVVSGEFVPAEQNGGMLNDKAELKPNEVGAQCNADGLLLISPTPKDAGPLVLPGGNFHVYDYALFWANLRADVEARLSAFASKNLKPIEMEESA